MTMRPGLRQENASSLCPITKTAPPPRESRLPIPVANSIRRLIGDVKATVFAGRKNGTRYPGHSSAPCQTTPGTQTLVAEPEPGSLVISSDPPIRSARSAIDRKPRCPGYGIEGSNPRPLSLIRDTDLL